jgi:glutamate formiminotransferase / 5-formyltetrahydrofolate cyclo-ligase
LGREIYFRSEAGQDERLTLKSGMSEMKIIECVPNFSEGKDENKINEIAAAVKAVEGVRLLDVCIDGDHNRSVLTFIGSPGAVEKGASAACVRALTLIDMTSQAGVHPRIGAVDVVPFIPLKNAVMEDAVETAHRFGRAFAERNGLPVYFYGEAALVEDRRELPALRRGGYEGLKHRVEEPYWTPDAGPHVFNSKSGATAVGAREPLVAFNINLNSDDLDAAKRIAAVIRHSGGGLQHVRAIGVPLMSRRVVQVSMNLTNYKITPPRVVFDRVKELAGEEGIAILCSELIGLIPEGALEGVSPEYLKLADFSEDRVLEKHLLD